uniref:Cadherin domain-containing protein n=1 Tax=Mola mola TaxID=94237 RepID=A0A3Q4AGZ4_MOLML
MRLDIIANKKYLDVNKETGELYIVEKIDREYLCTTKSSTSCYLKLEAILENPLRIFNIEVEILDMNDNAPQFRRDAIHLDISEATPKGERFSLSNAVDPDVGSNSVKTYHLSESDYFNIEVQTGRDGSKLAELILTKALDREQQAVHNLILTAVDGGKPARSGTVSIIVHVLDTNDNAPTFNKANYDLKIMENSPIGSLVINLNATDLDEGSNSDITYSYSLYTSEKTQETFNLNPSTGEITVKGMLNYEDFRIYDMEVIATDKGANSLSGQCTIKILIEDMNDNHPEISIKSFQSPVNENTELDTVIAVVSVSDKDSGDNGVVDLHIPDKMPFKLRESSDNYYELVVSEPLDREKVPEGSPPLSDNETMTLELLDVNDNVPQFPQSFYTIRVKENNAPGALLSSLSAFDPDLHENQYLVYFILEKEIANTSMSMLFSINPENGNLYKIDREYLCTKTLTLCYLKTEVILENPLRIFNIELEILDINDNAPHFRRDAIHLDISESTTAGERFSLSNAVDPDVGSNSVKTYHLSESEHFTIEIQSGRDGSKFAELILKKALDREQQAVHNLILTAVDGGKPARSGTASVIVHVLDTNDNAPTFNKANYDLKIMENSPIGSLVINLNATDLDEGSNSDITYSYSLYTSEKTQETFNLNPSTGEITVKGMLNYEDFRIYDMEVIATDKGANSLSGQCTIKILIEDMNDNHPEISIKSFQSPVNENTELDTVIAVVSVSDKDSGDNGVVDLHIPDKMPFKLRESSDNYYELVVSDLDQYNGEIRTMRMFSYRDPRHQRLVVVAKDNGEPALSATVTIKLSTVETAVKAYSDMTEVPLEYDIFSDLNLYLVIGLGSVSFLLLITILVTIVLKCQKPKASKAAPPCRNSVISERNSTIADSTLVSNDAYWYSLFLAETRKGKLVVRQPVPKGSRYIVSSLPRGTGLTDTSDSAASTLQV